jgi:thiol-disulfide isomerase/thioredoxin
MLNAPRHIWPRLSETQMYVTDKPRHTVQIRHCAAPWLILVATVAAGSLDACCAEPSNALASQSVLYLNDGDFFAGALKDSVAPDVVNWQSRGCEAAFQFPANAVRSAFFPSPVGAAAAKADYCFELSDGDRLFGSLVGLDANVVEVESESFGRLHIQRSHIRRVVPWRGSSAWEYSGPNGLADWHHLPEQNGWQEEAGHLLTEAPSASLRRQLEIPRQALIELAISWNKKLDFMFVLAAGSDKKHENEGVHLEVWDQTLVLVRESRDDADLATICDLKTVKNRLHLQILIDQDKGTITAHALDGTKLGDINAEVGLDKPLSWVFLRNHRGDIRFEQLIVSQWSGQAPPQLDVSRERVQKSDGSVIYGNITRYDEISRHFIVQDGTAQNTVPEADIASIVMRTDEAIAPSSIRVGCHDGTRLSGQLTQIEGEKIHFTRPGIVEPVVFPVADVRCLIGAPTQPTDAQKQASEGRLEMEGVRSHGMLVDGKANGATSCLVWQPRQSSVSSPLEQSVSGRIVYRDILPPAKPSPQQLRQQQQIQQRQAQRRGVWGAVVNAFSGPPQNAPAPRLAGYPHSIYLLAGDRIPCIVSRIDDRGVYFSSSVVETDRIPHDEIKALELVPRTASVTLAEEKRTRLLTLPRMQRNSPPTHLVASTSGDYLRTRLQSMDGQTLVAESRLESKRLPRGRVATIIWLHPAGGEKPPAADQPEPPAAARVQAVRADGVRLTFEPREFAGNALLGHSELLGECKVEVKSVDRILLGSMIEDSSEETAYDAWQFVDALDPKYVTDDASSGPATAGLNSPLIGKAAPEVRLNLLDGGKFKLSEEKGHIVVLDFWATWCAFCMQSMPEVDAVIHEFEHKNVKYVAVNMQEDTATISSALERAKLNPTVALDIDGAASEHYEVSSLPQLVIIDADGNVARMFIGVSSDYAGDLRKALNELLDPPLPSEPAAPPAEEAAGS